MSNLFHLTHWVRGAALAAGLVFLASAATKSEPAPRLVLGINHYRFTADDAPLLRQLSPSPVPLRLTFYWHMVAGSADYYDSQVAAATQAGVPVLGILGYSSIDQSSMPVDFDFTEISSFDISWHSVQGALPWGSNGAQGTAQYLWNATLEDGKTHSRVVEVCPTLEGRFVHGGVNFTVPLAHSVVLRARVGFLQGLDSTSRANFSVTYLDGNNYPRLASMEKGYDGATSILTADLTALAGRTVKLFLNVDPVPATQSETPCGKGPEFLWMACRSRCPR